MISSWRFDNQPGYEFKGRILGGLFVLIGNHKTAAGLQADSDALAEGADNGVDGVSQEICRRGSCSPRVWRALTHGKMLPGNIRIAGVVASH